MPLLITLLAIAVIGVAYYFHYRDREGYFAGRNLRLLSMLTAQIEGRVEMYSGFALKGGPTREMQAIWCKPPNNGETMRRLVLPAEKGWTIVLQPGKGGQAFSVPLVSVLRPVFARRIGAAFDVLVVAREDGTVLYSRRQPPSTSTLLHQEEEWIDEEAEEPHAGDTESVKTVTTAPSDSGERESGSAVVLTSLQALSKRKGWSEYEQLNPATLCNSNEQLDVELGGSRYVLFSQLYTFANPALAPGGKPHRWIVCVSASRFRFDVSEVSTTIVLIVAALVVLALCCWPFLRIALIDPRQPLTIADVVLVVICTIVGAAVITLALLNAFAYKDMSRIADKQLKDYSARLCEDFENDVVRAADMLAGAEKATQARAIAMKDDRDPRGLITKDLLGNEAIGNYPYLHSILWIDKDGNQKVRFDRVPAPLQEVNDRQYFQLATMQREWSVAGKKDYVLEWVRTKSTGDVWAVLAKKTTAPFSVVAVGTELIDITNTVAPPGVEIAIIDEAGEVVYHSDVQRIGYENFFTEADNDLELRSAVVARREGAVDAKYWGEDQSMYVRPLTGSGWTLVVFRPKRLTRVLNVEGSLLVLVMLLMNALVWFTTYILVLLIFPGYRAPRLWPDIARTRDYARLSVILIALLLLFCVDIYALAPWSAFWGILILPNLAIASTYLLLHRTGAERRFRIGVGVWLVLNALFVAHVILAAVDPTRNVGGFPKTVQTVLVLLAVAVAWLTFSLFTADRLREISSKIGYSRLYRLCGVLLLVVDVAMPVVGFFAISRRVETQLLVKYAQLRAAADLEHRIDHLETLNVPTTNSPAVNQDILCRPLDFMFGSSWGLRPQLLPSPPCASHPIEKGEAAVTLPPWAASLLPILYEDSLSIRPLFDGQSGDGLWSWHANDDFLTLVRKVRFDVDVSDSLWSDSNSLTDYSRRHEMLVIESALPRADLLTAGIHAAAGLPIAAALLALFWLASSFIAKRVLLVDVSEPDWLTPLPFGPTLGDFIFLVRRELDPAKLTANDPKDRALRFFDVSFEDLHQTNRWDEVLQEVDRSRPGRNVRITDFEYAVNDPEVNEKKLRWLERLLALPDRTVIIVSMVTPAYLMTTAPPQAPADGHPYFDRWRAVFDRFVCVDGEELQRRREDWELRQKFNTVSQFLPHEPKDWQEKETTYNSFLKNLAKEIGADPNKPRDEERFDATTDRERMLDEIGERAETYYAGLWAACREDEKLLLDQIASNGLANAGNRRTLRRLMARGLVRRAPNLGLFSETFRLYVLGAARREGIADRARAQNGPSTWDSLRIPFFVVIVAFVLFLLGTQKDLMATTTAVAAALTTGLPVIAKLVGAFTERRMGSPDHT